MGYGRTVDVSLAEKYFSQHERISSESPFTYHAVIFFVAMWTTVNFHIGQLLPVE